jgi:hypothetical protein
MRAVNRVNFKNLAFFLVTVLPMISAKPAYSINPISAGPIATTAPSPGMASGAACRRAGAIGVAVYVGGQLVCQYYRNLEEEQKQKNIELERQRCQTALRQMWGSMREIMLNDGTPTVAQCTEYKVLASYCIVNGFVGLMDREDMPLCDDVQPPYKRPEIVNPDAPGQDGGLGPYAPKDQGVIPERGAIGRAMEDGAQRVMETIGNQ